MAAAGDTSCSASVDRHATVTLRIIEGPHSGEEFHFESLNTLIVGRAPDAQWSLSKDPYFSRYHFRIEANPPQCRLIDLTSKHGTLVNGEKVNDVLLAHGDRIQCGTTVFAVAITAGTAAEEARTIELPEDFHPEANLAGPAAPISRVLTVGDFNLTRKLGGGAMGVVYYGVHRETGREVAVKVIRPNSFAGDNEMQIFLREANILAKLKHPRIVEYIHMGMQDGTMYLAMEYVPAIDFRGHLVTLPRERQISLVTSVMCSALEALQYAHERDVVHRDVKPTNLLVYEGDGRLQMKLADFGVAKTYHGSGVIGISNENDLRGTLGYIAPEQLKDSRYAKPPCDIYSAGACVYHLLSGKLAHDVTTASVAYTSILNNRARPLAESAPDLPPDLCAAVDRALSRDPLERFSSAQHMRQALVKFAEEGGA
jgi:serine/threonine-protein kinase